MSTYLLDGFLGCLLLSAALVWVVLLVLGP